MLRSPRVARFEAVLAPMTQLRFVVVPPKIGERLQATARTSVRARVLGLEFDSTLAPIRPEGHRLFIPASVWKERGLALGDSIPIEIWRVDPPPAVMPAELDALARATPGLREAWLRTSPSDRRQVDKHLEGLVSQEARERWIQKLAVKLLSPRLPRKKTPPSRLRG